MANENEIILSTNDRDFLEHLKSANIEGVTIVNEYRKYSGDELFVSIVIQVALLAIEPLARKIWEYFTKDNSKKARINDRPIPDELEETVIVFKQELKIQKRTTKKSEDDPR